MMNPELSTELKNKVLIELKKRNFAREYIDQLAIQYGKIIPARGAKLNGWEKVRIIIFPFFVPIHAIYANRYLSKGDVPKWKSYWKYLTLGWLFWTLLMLLIALFFLKY
ncbi:MAG: hypothetical protein ACXVJN_13155 [Mucilaginibacter sp.]